MMRPPEYIQNALDRHFPGTRLEWQPVLQWWILTDYCYWEDGMPAKDAWYPVTGLLRGIAQGKWCNRVPILYWGRIEDGHKEPLSLDAILNTLWKYRAAPTKAAVNASMDRLEAREDEAEARRKKRERDRARERASDMWSSMRRTTIGNGIALTDWKHAKAVDSEYARRVREQTEAQADELDAEVLRRARTGVGISSVRRTKPEGVI